MVPVQSLGLWPLLLIFSGWKALPLHLTGLKCSPFTSPVLSVPIVPWEQAVALTQQSSISVPQEFLKHAIPDYLVRGTDLFSL